MFHETTTLSELAAADPGRRCSVSPRSAQRSHRTLELHVLPHIGDRPVRDIGCHDIVDVLEPVWFTKPAAARRALYALRSVMRYAIGRGLRDDDPTNGAVARLPRLRRPAVARVLADNAVADVLAAVRRSRARRGTQLAFEFLVLTVRRPGEVCAARWDEMDLHDAVWTVPLAQGRSRWRTVNRVPLSTHALGVLEEARKLNGSGLVFSNDSQRAVSGSSLCALLRGLDLGVRPLSFRTTFGQWCAESGVSEYVCEACLDRFGSLGEQNVVCFPDVLSRRRPVMEEWGALVAGHTRSRGP